MKRSLLILVISVLMAGTAYAHLLDDTLAQPNHIIGRVINVSEEVTQTYEADFGYNSENMLTSYDFPDRNLNTQFIYTNNYLTNVHTQYSGFGEQYDVSCVYIYENGLL